MEARRSERRAGHPSWLKDSCPVFVCYKEFLKLVAHLFVRSLWLSPRLPPVDLNLHPCQNNFPKHFVKEFRRCLLWLCWNKCMNMDANVFHFTLIFLFYSCLALQTFRRKKKQWKISVVWFLYLCLCNKILSKYQQKKIYIYLTHFFC